MYQSLLDQVGTPHQSQESALFSTSETQHHSANWSKSHLTPIESIQSTDDRPLVSFHLQKLESHNQQKSFELNHGKAHYLALITQCLDSDTPHHARYAKFPEPRLQLLRVDEPHALTESAHHAYKPEMVSDQNNALNASNVERPHPLVRQFLSRQACVAR